MGIDTKGVIETNKAMYPHVVTSESERVATKAVYGIVDSLLKGSPNESTERKITKVGKTKRTKKGGVTMSFKIESKRKK